MKIRNRLSFVFTLSAAVVLCAVSIFIYYSSCTFQRNSFYQRLEERVRVTEKLFLEKDNLSEEVYLEIREKFLHTLPDETELVALADRKSILDNDSLDVLPETFVSTLLEEGSARFHGHHLQGVGQIYKLAGTFYAVVVVAHDKHGLAHIKSLSRILLVGGVAGLLLIFIISRLFAGQALKPIARKIKQAQGIGAFNLHERLPVQNSEDELGRLALAFNALLDRLETAFETQKNFISNASHEIRNPLTTIIGEAEVTLEKERTPAEYTTSIRHIIREAERLNTLVNRLLELSKAEASNSPVNGEDVRLDEVLIQAKAELDKALPDNRVVVDLSGLPGDQERLVVSGNQELLKAALVNVMDNACKFSDNQKVTAVLDSSPEQIDVLVSDRGIGIPEEDRSKVFQPLYRGVNARSFKGSGIGLALTYRIVHLHRGLIDLYPNDERGTVVRLSFPVKNKL